MELIARRAARGLLIYAVFAVISTGTALACPACKEALADDPGGAQLTRGYARSIYLLMWTPYLLFGGVTFAIVRSSRRAKK